MGTLKLFHAQGEQNTFIVLLLHYLLKYKRFTGFLTVAISAAEVILHRMRWRLKSAVFWDVTSYKLVQVHECFRGMYCFHLVG
jgi:hypothetical protein